MNTRFSVIIPTLWLSDKLLPMLDIYREINAIAEIIIINNAPDNTPDYVKNFPKVRLLNQKKNIYVNPAWNLGVKVAKHKIILANDDIVIYDLAEIIQKISKINYDIIGFNPKADDISFQPLTGIDFSRRLPHGFGFFMFVNNYSYIPEEIKIDRGDVLLAEMSTNVFIFGSGNCTYDVSKSVKSNPDFLNMHASDFAEYNRIRQNTLLARHGIASNFPVYSACSPEYDSQCFHPNIYHDFGLTTARNNRKSKILFHENLFLQENEISIYLDSNIIIAKQLNIKSLLGDADIAVFKHNLRNTIFDEAIPAQKRLLSQGNNESEIELINKQIQAYKKKKHAQQRPLCLCGILIRRNNQRTRDFCRKWYIEIERYSFRDQLSFPAIKSSCKINILPFSIFKEYFKILGHKTDFKTAAKLIPLNTSTDIVHYKKTNIINKTALNAIH